MPSEHQQPVGDGLFIGNLNDMCGLISNKTPYIKEVYKEKNKCIHTKIMLENGLMYLYRAFQSHGMNASTTYTKYKP